MKKTVVSPSVPGFKLTGMACGIKPTGKKDLALIVSDTPAVTVGLFTRNRVAAPPIVWCRKVLRKSKTIQALIVNSGCANAYTGLRGMEDCKTITQNLAETLNIPQGKVLIASTGTIGRFLPTDKIVAAFPALKGKLSPKGWIDAAQAIMTTDLTMKTARVEYTHDNRKIVVGGIAKGSGMIHPNMATMLAFVFTDAAVEHSALDAALREANDRSFNSITVDGDCSTNDSLVCLANGKAGNAPIRKSSPGYKPFAEALTEVCRQLAIEVVKDGEGATKLVTIRVEGARTRKDAQKVGFAVATSNLVKTAIFGEDPNWGRIVCAIGNAGVAIKPDHIDITLNSMPLVKDGEPVPNASMRDLQKKMKSKEILIVIGLHCGAEQAEVYTCDLSYDYVKINAEYTT